MAFGLILHSTISNHEGVAVKVELYKDGFAGSATEILESSKIELHTVGDENEYKPIRQTKLSWILEARNQNILDIVYDIHAQPEGTYLVKVLYDGVEEYTGIATVDEYTEPDEYFPIPVEVTAHDLAALKSLEADYTDARVYVLNYIADELKKLGFELPIRTINEYYPFGGTYGETDADDSLKTLQFNPLTFFEAEDDEEGISSEEGTVDTSYSALEQICSAYNIELIQKANEWWLIQLPELTQNSIRLRRYNADGVYQDSSTYDPRRTLDSSLRVLSGGIRRKNIGYRRALAAYQHGDIQTWLIRNFDFAQEQAIIGVPIYWEYTGNDADVRIRPVNTDSKYAVYLPPTAEVDPLPFGTPYPHDITAGQFASLGSHVLKQSGGVIATKSGVTNTLKISVSAVVTGGPQVLPLAPMFYLVKVGNYYLKSDGSWTASVNYINFERGGIRYGGFRIDEIETDELIEDGNVYVELSQIIRTAETGPIDGVAWDFLDIDLLEDGEGAQQTRTFIGSVTTETRTSEGFELPTTKVGDGVFASHPGALYMPSQTAYTSSDWKYRSITQRLIHELNIQNTLNLFGRPRNSFDMYMVGYIHPSEVITRDGIRYRPVDVVWDLISNESRVITVEIRSESVTVDYRRVDSAERFTTIRGVTTGGSGTAGDVISVNGKTGIVSLTTTDIPEGTNLYHTAQRVTDIGDARYGQLAAANTWTQTNIFARIDSNDYRVLAESTGAIDDLFAGKITSALLQTWADAFMYAGVQDIEYHDGNDWVEWAGKSFDGLFDGRAATQVTIPTDRPRFRFTILAPEWHGGGLLQIYQEWTSGGTKAYDIQAERSADGTTGWSNLGTKSAPAGRYWFNVASFIPHSNERYYRFTFDFDTLTANVSLRWIKLLTSRLSYGIPYNLPITGSYTNGVASLTLMPSYGVIPKTATGRVGVGTTSPAERFHVTGGDVRFDGDLKAGANTVIDSSRNITAQTGTFGGNITALAGTFSGNVNLTGNQENNRISLTSSVFAQLAVRSWGGSAGLLFSAKAADVYSNGTIAEAGNTVHAHDASAFGSSDHRAKMIWVGHNHLTLSISAESTGEGQPVTWYTLMRGHETANSSFGTSTDSGDRVNVSGAVRTSLGYKVGSSTVINSDRDAFLKSVTGIALYQVGQVVDGDLQPMQMVS
jgi:hypothetical protein